MAFHRTSSDEQMPTSHTTTLHEAHNDSQRFSLSNTNNVPNKDRKDEKKEKSEKLESSSASVHSSSPSGTRNPSKVDVDSGTNSEKGGGHNGDGGKSAGKEAKDLEAADEKRGVTIVDWDGLNDPCNPRK